MLPHYFHLTFPFPSPKPTAHFNNWSRAPIPLISTFSLRYTQLRSPIFVSGETQNQPLHLLGFILIFFVFSMFLHFLCCVYWDLGSLGCECLFIYASFFTLYSSIALMLLFLFLFFFYFRSFSVLFLCYSHGFMNNVYFALLLAWEKKNYLYLDHLCPTYPTLAPEFWTVWLYLWFLFLIRNKKKG